MNDTDMSDKEEHTTWPEFAIVLFDLLTGRKAEITYEFVDVQLFVPLESGPDSEYAVWKLNGAIKVRAREDQPG